MAAGVSLPCMMFVQLLLLVLVSEISLISTNNMWAPPDDLLEGDHDHSNDLDLAQNNGPTDNLVCPTQDCTCFRMLQFHLVDLQCSVTKVTSALQLLVSYFKPEQTGYVGFTCTYAEISDQDYAPESKLWDGAFKDLNRLNGLAFVFCRFRSLSRDAFRELHTLEELVIHGADLHHVDPALLAHLPRLKRLQISYSGMTKMFSLCNSSPLVLLNISGNAVASMQDAGVYCISQPLSNMEVLDLSYNSLKDLPDWISVSMPNLQHLRLIGNHISGYNVDAFPAFRNLASLDISNNSYRSFTSHFFKDTPNLIILHMSNNMVHILPDLLLNQLSLLQQLHLDNMGLDNRVWREILNLRQLRVLNLANNTLTLINEDVLSRFLHLQQFLASHNRISGIPPNAFAYQAFEHLDLSHNQIESLPPYSLMYQSNLQSILLNNNRISSIKEGALNDLENVTVLDLSYNRLNSLPPRVFSNSKQLKILNLQFNNLTALDLDTFSHNLALEHLNLSQNALTTIPELNINRALKAVDLSFNVITRLEPTTFASLENLEVVYLNNNELETLPLKLFLNCKNLKHLDLSNNEIIHVDELFLSNINKLEYLNLARNRITDIGSVLMGLKKLDELNLAHNSLTQITWGQFPRMIRRLDLGFNDIHSIYTHPFKSLKQLEWVSLRDNNLTSLSKMAVEVAFNLAYDPIIDVTFNPFVCDCHMSWVKDWIDGNLEDVASMPSVRMAYKIKCTSPFYDKPAMLSDIPRSDFLCSYTNHCNESCMCCDFNLCHCKYTCPSMCSCYIGDRIHHVRCSDAGLAEIPKNIPEGSTHLHLDGNSVNTLYKHTFIALGYVQVLHLNHSQIHVVQNDTFKGLKSLRTLYLNDNHIKSVFVDTFKYLGKLQELHLENNDILFIDPAAFAILTTVSYVNLQGNAMTQFSVPALTTAVNVSNSNGSKCDLYLSGNPWSCEPDFACAFLHFLLTYASNVADLSYVECLSTVGDENDRGGAYHGVATRFLALQYSTCADNDTIVTSLDHTNSFPKTYILIAVCLIIVFIIFLLIIVFLNRHFLQVVCFTHFGCRVFKMAKSGDDNERPYDAFISYSNKDEHFVIQQLAPRLETGDKKFRLCVHYRDFPVGACVAETIVRSVEASKRIILVVSNNFLDSEWCKFEFQTAHQQVLNERRNRVILILMPDVDPSKLDGDLKSYVRTRTYLKFDDHWFWEKLMFAMPDIRHRPGATPNYQQQQLQLQCSPSLVPSNRELQQFEHITRHNQPGGDNFGLNPHPGVNTAFLPMHNDMYEIPMLETQDVIYHLAQTQLPHADCCNCSNSSSGYHNGSMEGSCAHYEEVGPSGVCYNGSLANSDKVNPPPLPSRVPGLLTPKRDIQSKYV